MLGDYIEAGLESGNLILEQAHEILAHLFH